MLFSVCIASKQAINLAPGVGDAWFERKLLKTCMHLAAYSILRSPQKIVSDKPQQLLKKKTQTQTPHPVKKADLP